MSALNLLSVPLGSIQDVAAVAGPVAAAIAAIASLLAVRLTRSIARSASLPDLSVQPLVGSGGVLGASIHNAGGGAARGALFIVAEGEHSVTVAIGHGVIRPNERFEVWTNMPSRGGGQIADAMYVRCRDRFGNAHGWTHKEVHDEKKGRWGGKPSPEVLADAFHHAFPAIRLDQLQPGNASVRGPL